MADEETPPTEDPIEALQREFSEVCKKGGTEVALAHLIAREQAQAARLDITLAYTDPRDFPPPGGTPREVLEIQADMRRALRSAEQRMAEVRFWLECAAGHRQHMVALLGRKAPPPRDDD